MKTVLIFCLILFTTYYLKAESLTFNKLNAKQITDTSSYPIANLSGLNWSYYLNKPINTLLFDLNGVFPGYIIGRIYGTRLRLASKLNIYYGNGIGVILTVNDFQHLNQYSESSSWDISLFRQENISKIELWDQATCIMGCE
jgi:hypothetical protein